MVCQKSAMHEKLPPHASTSTCFQPLSLSVSQWSELQSEPESCVLPSRETCLMRADKRPVSRSPNRRHGSLGRRHQTWFSSKGKSHTNTQAGSQGDNSKETEAQCTTAPRPSKGTRFTLQEKQYHLSPCAKAFS